ncbi:MAG: hypothetical protein KDA70_17325, partial [Planctomycetaceae bacterium]|nr:hypothetical protein [Planctomycetaceae bacterium]
RWDGHTKPATHTALVSSIDIVPTLLHAAGQGKQASALPGVNLLPSARGETTLPEDRAVYGEVFPGDAASLNQPEREVAHRWIRKGNLKLITSHNPNAQGKTWNDYTSGDVLFDLEHDPGETQNLIHDPKSAASLAELRRLLDAWWNPAKTD